jgi:hypothetical protein
LARRATALGNDAGQDLDLVSVQVHLNEPRREPSVQSNDAQRISDRAVLGQPARSPRTIRDRADLLGSGAHVPALGRRPALAQRRDLRAHGAGES